MNGQKIITNGRHERLISPVTANDIKALQRSNSKAMHLVTTVLFPLFIALLLTSGAVNLYLCWHFSEMADTSMAEVIRGWFAGIDVLRWYSGTYLKAQEKWVTGITQFAIAGLLAMVCVGCRRSAKRNARVLKFIQQRAEQNCVFDGDKNVSLPSIDK